MVAGYLEWEGLWMRGLYGEPDGPERDMAGPTRGSEYCLQPGRSFNDYSGKQHYSVPGVVIIFLIFNKNPAKCLGTFMVDIAPPKM
jgi:hypothetical protein